MLVNEFNEYVKVHGMPTTVQEAIAIGWYDWFCSDRSLLNRSKKVVRFIQKLVGPKVSQMEVQMKNCSPALSHTLYEMVQLVDRERNVVTYVVVLGDKRETDPVVLYSREHGFNEPVVVGRKAVLEYLNGLQ